MRTKSTLLLLLALFLTFSVKAQVDTKAEGDTTRTLIITETSTTEGATPMTFVEVTNVGETTLDLSDFKLASYTPWADARSNDEMGASFPEVNLEPDSSYVVAYVYEGENNPELWDEYGGPTSNPHLLEKVDHAVHMDEYSPGDNGGEDQITEGQQRLLDHWGGGVIARVLENYENVAGDSVFVDGLGTNMQAGDPYATVWDWEGYADVAGVSNAWAYGYILVRKTTVTEGNLDWDDARGTNLQNSEWLPIPMRETTGGYGNKVFTTIGHHGNSDINENYLSSNSIDIDFQENTMTVPWGVYKDSIMNEFNLGPGLAWHFYWSGNTADSTHNIVRSGDTLTMYAVGETLKQKDFLLEQGDAPDSMNQVFPLNRKYYSEGAEDFLWEQPYYVTSNAPEIDSIGGVGYRGRVDSLFKYLEKAPGASWEINWMDDMERVDVKRGDILKVTASDGSVKDYYIAADSVPAASSNSSLSAITWPDIPDHLRQNPAWNGDTIPDFSSGRLEYKVNVPYGTETVPALDAIPQDLNAQISVNRAKTINGPVADRTTTIEVTAEDDTTVTEYTVVFNENIPEEKVQPFTPHPIFTELVTSPPMIEITNPGNTPLDLSNYMIVKNARPWGAGTLAEQIQNDSWGDRSMKYIPGYKPMAETEAEWDNNPGILAKDLEVNPVLQPGESIVIGRGHWLSVEDLSMMDIVFAEEGDMDQEKIDEVEATGTAVVNIPGNGVADHYAVEVFGLYKVMNDSVTNGTKPFFDPTDYKLVDFWGDYESAYAPEGDTLGSWQKWWTVQRKPDYWRGDTLPGYQGSWGRTPEESEWVLTTEAELEEEGLGRDNLYDNIGIHSLDPINAYKSTVSSYTYKVSDGYKWTDKDTLRIEGITTGTTVDEMIANLIKAHEDQALDVIGSDGTERAGDDAVADQDTLKVTSADSSNVSKYLLGVSEEGLNSDALLTSTEYTIDTTAGGTGTISGISMGATLKEVRDNVTKPATAKLNVIDTAGNLVPYKHLNMDTNYVQTLATHTILFEVIAEDGVTEIEYQLKLDIGDDEAYLFSDVYSVDQELNRVSLIPQGTNVKTLFANLYPNEGASVKLVDKIGMERTQGDVRFDDKVIVVAPDSSSKKTYHLKFKEESAGSEAYVVSQTLGVDQEDGDIWGFDPETSLDIFMGLLTPAPEATMAVIDTDSSKVESGNVLEDYMLKVTSGDSTVNKYYNLWAVPNEPGTQAYVTSDSLNVDSEGMTISDVHPESTVSEFVALLTPAPRATMTVLNADGSPVESGDLADGFTLRVTSGDGDMVVTYDLDFVEVGINPLAQENFRVYPNPATSNIYVEGLADEGKVVIRNILGRAQKMVDSKEVQNGTISVRDLPSGIYLIYQENQQGKSNSVKLIIE